MLAHLMHTEQIAADRRARYLAEAEAARLIGRRASTERRPRISLAVRALRRPAVRPAAQ